MLVGLHDRPPLVRRQPFARRPLVRRLEHRIGVEQFRDLAREAPLDPVDRRIDDPPAVEHEPARRAQRADARRDGVRGSQKQPRSALGQVDTREMAVAVGLRLAQRVDDPGVQPRGVVGRQPQRAGERVGGRESDAVDVGGGVRIGAQSLDRAGAERPDQA